MEKYLVLMRQDVGRRIRTPRTTKIKDKTTPEAEDYGTSRTVTSDAAVLVSDHSIVMRMSSFNRPETELSNDAIYIYL